MSGQPIAEAASGGALWLVLTGTAFGRVWIWRFGIAAALGALMLAQATVARDWRSLKGAWLALGARRLATWRRWRWSDTQPTGTAPSASPDHYGCRAPARCGRVAGCAAGARRSFRIRIARRRRRDRALPGARRSASRHSEWRALARCCFPVWATPGTWSATCRRCSARLTVGCWLRRYCCSRRWWRWAAINRRRLTPQVRERRCVRAAPAHTKCGGRNHRRPLDRGHCRRAGRLGSGGSSISRLALRSYAESRAAGGIGARSLGFWRMRCHPLHNRARPRVRATAGEARGTANLRRDVVRDGVGTRRRPWVLLTTPAYPTTYAMSPVKYTTAAIAGGGAAYDAYCVQCHGLHGRGDGPRQRPCRSSQPISSSTGRTIGRGTFSGGSRTASRIPGCRLFLHRSTTAPSGR